MRQKCTTNDWLAIRVGYIVILIVIIDYVYRVDAEITELNKNSGVKSIESSSVMWLATRSVKIKANKSTLYVHILHINCLTAFLRPS